MTEGDSERVSVPQFDLGWPRDISGEASPASFLVGGASAVDPFVFVPCGPCFVASASWLRYVRWRPRPRSLLCGVSLCDLVAEGALG